MRLHGHASRKLGASRTYYTWKNMLARCEHPERSDFHRYGGAGVTVCAEWHRFDAFLRDMGERPEGKTIDRIDGRRGYEPGNCRWATLSEQARNQKSNRVVDAFGERRTIAEWAERAGMPYKTLYNRVAVYGWTAERALTARVRPWGDRPNQRRAAFPRET